MFFVIDPVLGPDFAELVADRIVLRTGGSLRGGTANPNRVTPSEQQGIVLLSPSGSRWALIVSNTGQLSVVAAS